jgi:hypothetical protein
MGLELIQLSSQSVVLDLCLVVYLLLLELILKVAVILVRVDIA